MASFSYEVEIQATPEKIWATWMDVEHWPDWAPPMKKLEMLTPGNLRAGSRVKINAEGAPVATWEVSDFRPHQYFEWSTSVRGVGVKAGHAIRAVDDTCVVTLDVRYSGIMATIFRPMIMRTARKNVVAEAHGLRERCES